MPDSQKLDVVYREIADTLYYRGYDCDDSPTGKIANWIRNNVKFREDTLFFIVLGVNAELHKLIAAENKEVKYCEGQKRLFEIESRLLYNGQNVSVNPKFGKLTD